MSIASGFAYAQARIQARYGDRADSADWQRLNAVYDLGGYLQAAQQTPLRAWVLGINASHRGHDIELALRQKYRGHVDEVADWLPAAWRDPLRWIKRLWDLPLLHYLMVGEPALEWMNEDPDIRAFTADDPTLRIQQMRATDCGELVNAWQRGDALVPAWLGRWRQMRPTSRRFEPGLARLEWLLLRRMNVSATPRDANGQHNYERIENELRLFFRRHGFAPTGVCAYLALVAIDLHQLRGALMLRRLFPEPPRPPAASVTGPRG